MIAPTAIRATVLGLSLTMILSLPGQTIFLKDGKRLEGKNLRRSGTSVMTTVPVGSGQGEIGYAVNSISRIEFPQAQQIPAAEELFVNGKYPEALAQIEQVVVAQTPFKDISGNQWLDAASIKLVILHAMGQEKQAAPLISEMTNVATDPEIVFAGQVWQAAALVKSGDTKKALAILENVVDNSARKDTLANAWLRIGFCQQQLENYPAALLASLHVPVFFPEQKISLSPALLVSAQAYSGMEDFSQAQRALEDVIKNFPASNESKIAKAELPKIVRRSSAAQPENR